MKEKSIEVQIVDEIVKDLRGRRGLKGEWNACEPEIQREIKAEWRKIIRAKLIGNGLLEAK